MTGIVQCALAVWALLGLMSSAQPESEKGVEEKWQQRAAAARELLSRGEVDRYYQEMGNVCQDLGEPARYDPALARWLVDLVEEVRASRTETKYPSSPSLHGEFWAVNGAVAKARYMESLPEPEFIEIRRRVCKIAADHLIALRQEAAHPTKLTMPTPMPRLEFPRNSTREVRFAMMVRDQVARSALIKDAEAIQSSLHRQKSIGWLISESEAGLLSFLHRAFAPPRPADDSLRRETLKAAGIPESRFTTAVKSGRYYK